MSKAVVLFSGGQDSTTCLYYARIHFDEVIAVSVRYGQRHVAEIDAAEKIVELAGVKHVVLHMPALEQLADSALVGAGAIAGDGGRPDVVMPQGLPTSFVPARNAVLFTLAAAAAVKHGARHVVTGICQTDYSGYPDCREVFRVAMEKAISLGLPSSAGPIVLLAPLMDLSKAETVRFARRLPGAWDALGLTVTCYEGQRPGCGKCPSCELRARGFAEAGLADPAFAPPEEER